MDDRRAPDFARTVEIHRKPGYDPVELFLDPAIRIPPLTVGWKLMKRKAGFRSLAGRHPARRHAGEGIARSPDWMGRGRSGVHQPGKALVPSTRITSVEVHELVVRHLNDRG